MKHALHIILILSLLSSGMLLLFQEPLYAQNLWSQPIELSPPQYGQFALEDLGERRYGWSWLPDLTVGPEGSVHSVWFGGLITTAKEGGSIDLLMYRERTPDGTWTPVSEIAAPAVGGYTVRTSIVSSRDGMLHLIYRAGTQIVYSHAPLHEARQAQAWSEPRLISDGGYYTALAVDQRGHLHAFWTDGDIENTNPQCLNCSDIFYRRSSDSGSLWTTPVRLSITPEGENRPQVKIDPQNRIHIVWDEGVDWYAGQGQPQTGVYRRSDDGGQTWNDPIKFRLPDTAVQTLRRQQIAERQGSSATNTERSNQRPPLDAVQQTALAVDSAGNPFVVFRGVLNDRIYFQRSFNGGDTWSTPVEILGVRARNINDNNLDYYSLATDGSDNLHLLMVGFPSSGSQDRLMTPALLHLTFNGSRWSLPRVIAHNELYPELPRITVYNGNQLHAVWFTRSLLFQGDGPEDRPIHQIWYSNALINARNQAPLPLFTSTPAQVTPTVQSVATLIPEPTPLPLELRQVEPLTRPPIWEIAGLTTIGTALLSTVLILGIVVAGFILTVRSRRE